MDSRGARGILLGHLASNIALIWNQSTDRIQRVADGRVDEGEISLSEMRSQKSSPFTDATAGQAGQIGQIGLNEPPTTVVTSSEPDLRPAKGFAAYAPASTPMDEKHLPRSHVDVLRRPDRERWLQAMEHEMGKLREKNVWDLVRTDELPPGMRAYPGRWVFDRKEELEPTDPKSYKARWVIRGNLVDKNQLHHDYCTYAPVVSSTTTRMLFALAAWNGWNIRQADAAVAFLNGTLRDTVYMRQPMGFEQGEKGTLVCKLNQSLYGLAPAARIWYDTLTNYLHYIGFRVCNYDPGLFIHGERPHLYLTSHVDDFKIVAANPADSQWVIDALSSRFELKDMGQIKHYLGMDVRIQPDGIFPGQGTYAEELIRSFGMEAAHTHKTPLDSGLVIDDEPDEETNTREYQRGTGCLQWLATKTRPDIAHAACLLAQYNSAPTRKCWNALMHVIRYLRGSAHRGLFYPKGDQQVNNAPIPVGYSDSDWAGSNTGRKSIGGYVFLLAGSPISWQAKKQTCIATSSNEAEYMAASEAAKEACWIRRVFGECVRFKQEPTVSALSLNMDNQGAIALTSSDGTKRSKHIDIRFHHIRDLQQQGVLVVKGVQSRDMAADGLTKILRTEAFERFLSLISMASGSRGGEGDG